MATFRKLKSGKWQARVLQDNKQVSIGVFRTKKEAQITANEAEKKIYLGQTLTDKDMMFSQVVHEWLYLYKQSNVKESTFNQLKVIVNLHILPFFGDKKIISIRRPEIKKWLNDYYNMEKNNGKPKYSYGARLKYLSVLKSIFHYAVHEMEVLEKNPADKLKIPMKDKVETDNTVKYYSLEELTKLIRFMETYKPPRFNEYQLYYMLIYFLSQTGLRISEALALRWSDFEKDKVTIQRQTSRDDNNNLKLISLKNSSSYRKIKLDKHLLDELNQFKYIQNKLINSDKHFFQNKDGIIFQNFAGNYLTPSIIRENFQGYCQEAGVDYKGTHGFRHTHAVLLLESGASIKYVSQRLGHKTIKTTSDTYLDVTEKIDEDELNKFISYTNMLNPKQSRHKLGTDNNANKKP